MSGGGIRAPGINVPAMTCTSSPQSTSSCVSPSPASSPKLTLMELTFGPQVKFRNGSNEVRVPSACHTSTKSQRRPWQGTKLYCIPRSQRSPQPSSSGKFSATAPLNAAPSTGMIARRQAIVDVNLTPLWGVKGAGLGYIPHFSSPSENVSQFIVLT